MLKIIKGSVEEELDLSVSVIDDNLTLKIDKERGSYKNLDYPFYNVEFDLKDFKVSNIEEIISKWKHQYNETLLKGNLEEADYVLILDKYFSDEDSINFILRYYGYIPFIILVYMLKENRIDNYKFLDLMDIEEISFDIDMVQEENENEIVRNYIGNISKNFDFVNLKSKLKNRKGLRPMDKFDILFELKGESIHKIENVLEVKKIQMEVKYTINGELEDKYRIIYEERVDI